MSRRSEHPRPLLRRAWQSLDGDFDFALDEVGRDEPGEVVFDRRIRVPFAPETPASGIGESTRGCRCWYRRRVEVDPVAAGEHLIMHIGAADRIAEVWAGGQRVAFHVGGYTSFSADVTRAAVNGEFDVAVRIDDDPHAHDVPRGKQEWRETPHGIWYPRTTGIWRTVWLERVPAVHIAELTWTPDLATRSVILSAVVAGPVPVSARLHVRLHVDDRMLVDDAIGLGHGVIERRFFLGDGGIDDRQDLLVWRPGNPRLIDAEVAVVVDGAVIDKVESYTALRSVGVADGRLVLNERPLPLRLVLDQGYWSETGLTPPSIAALRRDVELTQALGFNGARKHQKVEDPRYLALADEMGMLVWAEMPSAYHFDTSTVAALSAEWTEIVKAQRGHPSVVAWVPVNESWGLPSLEADPRQRALVRALTALTEAVDGTRPVSPNDGWETTGGQIVGVHDYSQDPAVLRDRYGHTDHLEATVVGRRDDGKLVDLDRRGRDGRAVVLSEFGGVALIGEGEGGWGYDAVPTPAALVERVGELWAAVHDSDALAGACWTQLTDTYQEKNGLLGFDRTPKADLTELADAVTSKRPI